MLAADLDHQVAAADAAEERLDDAAVLLQQRLALLDGLPALVPRRPPVQVRLAGLVIRRFDLGDECADRGDPGLEAPPEKAVHGEFLAVSPEVEHPTGPGHQLRRPAGRLPRKPQRSSFDLLACELAPGLPEARNLAVELAGQGVAPSGPFLMDLDRP